MDAVTASKAPEMLLKLVPLALVFVIADLPWLYGNQRWAAQVFQKVQGAPLRLHIPAAIPVYFALAYLLLHASSPLSAFGIGFATYAVYDFTNLATLTNYDPMFAIADTFWGGILFSVAYFLSKRLNLL
jgi:uncharacterized membrane protein